MKRLPRLLMLVASLCLLALFVFPMWRITLIAPQYPNGVTMYIWINKLGGDSPSVLQNINILNHYVGMKYIEPDAIPELRYFPYIIGIMVGLGLLAAAINKRLAFLSWGIIMVVLAALGMYDFYLWEYDYGHNLSDTAPIKIPGASFQPPLFGTKKIINFTAQSYPHTGGYFATLSILLAFVAWWLKGKFMSKPSKAEPYPEARSSRPVKNKTTRIVSMASIALMSLIIVGCSADVRPIDYGKDNCEYCKMTVVDPQFAAEAVTSKGRIYTFDAIECLVNYVGEKEDVNFKLLMVNDYTSPPDLIDARTATYLISEKIPSPMGAFLSGYESRAKAQEYQDEFGGKLYDWHSLKNTFENN
ncbi:MAG: nitrous oxide reductase accessory protein NosL [Saprospiraceae bacterium]|nr:nitrous oxide reductase accessory protein NosL [Saprospiraceae bacterium]